MKNKTGIIIYSLFVTGLALVLTCSCKKEDEPDITGIAAGYGHSLALKSDGTLWGWGYNNYYQLGDGTTTDTYVPGQINLN